jgi:UDP-N-acetylmuramate dehydrogenase
MNASLPFDQLRIHFAGHLQENVVMANFTTAHVGGPVDALLPVNTLEELTRAADILWKLEAPFIVIGSGSNVLFSDRGLSTLVLLNRARNVKIDTRSAVPTVWAESGANLGHMSRRVALRGLSGLEWAATIPGTVGGAVYGNAGAHGGDIHGSLILAEILHRDKGRESWPVDRLEYSYRSSLLKREHLPAIVLAARFKAVPAAPAEVQKTIESLSEQRQATQPPGASLGSMFKNPEGDYAGRLIEAAGLKGRRVGGAEISPVHANFFVNNGKATAQDVWELIRMARKAVARKFGIKLELEIELLGEFRNQE